MQPHGGPMNLFQPDFGHSDPFYLFRRGYNPASLRDYYGGRPEVIHMSATQDEKAARFGALHDGRGLFVIANPRDVSSARILASFGFQALATTIAASACAVAEGITG